MPGKLYQYEGDVDVWCEKGEECMDTLCVSVRDFLGYLERYVKSNIKRRVEGWGVVNRGLSLLVDVLELGDC